MLLSSTPIRAAIDNVSRIPVVTIIVVKSKSLGSSGFCYSGVLTTVFLAFCLKLNDNFFTNTGAISVESSLRSKQAKEVTQGKGTQSDVGQCDDHARV